MRLLPLLCLCCLGCGDFLTVDPQDELSRDDALSTIEGLNAGVIGCYNLLGEKDLYQIVLPIYADIVPNLQARNDQTAVSLEDITGRRTEFITVHALDLSAAYLRADLDDTYEDYYTLLYQATDVIAATREFGAGTQVQRQSIAGEARAIRALAHFDLLRLFAQSYAFDPSGNQPGIALLDELPVVFDQPARASVAEGYASVRNDLERAFELIDPALARRSDDPYWITPTVVAGLLARVAAYQQDWTGCREWADRCLALTNRSLTDRASYLGQWADRRLEETLWELDVQRQLVDPPSNVLDSPAKVVGSGNDDVFLQVADDLMDRFPEDDLRRQLIVDNAEGDRTSAKWPFAQGIALNLPMLRLSEVYLLRAEALVELGEPELAAADYVRIRRRAVANEPDPPTDREILRRLIRTERRLELHLEGHHFYDLGRWGAPLERTNCADFVERCTLPYPSPYFIAPIPLEAILNNDNLVQNEGY